MVKILEKIRKFSKEESGASMVMVVLSMVVIFGFTAFAVDFGNAYTTKVSMQDACDLSALAAADSLPQIDINTAISFTQFYSWAVSKQSPVLLDSLNTWLDKFQKEEEYQKIYKKYYDKE